MLLRTGTEMPELNGATEWLSGEARREQLVGAPALVYFWATSCHICKENMPTLQQWKDTYGPQGLKVVAIHAPREEGDLDVARVREIVTEFHINEPCAIDNEHALAEKFQINGMWPHYFLFDAEGKLRSRSAGNAGLSNIESTLNRIIDAPQPQPA